MHDGVSRIYEFADMGHFYEAIKMKTVIKRESYALLVRFDSVNIITQSYYFTCSNNVHYHMLGMFRKYN